jgi:hypothetical protein
MNNDAQPMRSLNERARKCSVCPDWKSGWLNRLASFASRAEVVKMDEAEKI